MLAAGGSSALTTAHPLSCREEGASLGRAREVCGAKLVLRQVGCSVQVVVKPCAFYCVCIILIMLIPEAFFVITLYLSSMWKATALVLAIRSLSLYLHLTRISLFLHLELSQVSRGQINCFREVLSQTVVLPHFMLRL